MRTPRLAKLLCLLVLTLLLILSWAQAAPLVASGSGYQVYPNPPTEGATNHDAGASRRATHSSPAASGIAYSVITSTGNSIIPGTYDIGNHSDGSVTFLNIPFPISFYGTTYTATNASSDGYLQFVDPGYYPPNGCVPNHYLNSVIYLYWAGMVTNNFYGGIYTATLGTSPTREFVIEWRAQLRLDGSHVNAEIIFHENSPTITAIYGITPDPYSQDPRVAGVQEADGLYGTSFTQLSCNQPNLPSGLRADYIPYGITTPTPRPTNTPCSGYGATTWPALWHGVSPLPIDVDGAAAASDGTYAYVAGGYSTSVDHNLNQLFRYDPATDSWVILAPMLYSTVDAAAVYSPINRKLYVFGGDINITQIYDIASDTWSLGQDMPQARYSMAVGYDHGKVYLAGGAYTDLFGNTSFFNQLWAYDPLTDHFITLASLPAAQAEFGAATIDGILYAAGGVGYGQPNALYAYDIAHDQWTQRANLPFGLAAPGAAVLDGQLWLFGGETVSGSQRTEQVKLTPASIISATELYNPATNSWSAGPSLRIARVSAASASVAGYILAFGGSTSPTGTTASVEVSANGSLCPAPTATGTPPTSTPTPSPTPGLCPGGDIDNPGTWQQVSHMPVNVYGAGATSDGSYAYTIGGFDLAAYTSLSEFSRYDPATGIWVSLPSLPRQLYGVAAVYVPDNNKVYAFGGVYRDGYANYQGTQIYDLASGTWSSGPDMPQPRMLMSAGYWNGKVYLVGGFMDGYIDTARSQVWQYDVAAGTFSATSSMPVALGGAGSGVISGTLYVAGGLNGTNNNLNTLYAYDIAHDHWSQEANLTQGLNGPAAAAVGNKLWLFGGGTPNNRSGKVTLLGGEPQTTNATEIYDTISNVWSSGPGLNEPRSYLSGAAVGSVIVAAGGYDGISSTNIVEAAFADCNDYPTSTPTATPSPTITSNPTATTTPIPATSTMIATPLLTATPTNTSSPAPSPTSTPCVNPFVDIQGDVFYTAINYFYCSGVISGVDNSHYAPSGTATRAQFAKVVILAFGLPLYTPPPPPYFNDVPTTYYAYQFIEIGLRAGILNGFDDATCLAAGVQPPCYLPNHPITRGQLTKLVVNTAHYTLITPTGGPSFTDVPETNVFYPFIETAHQHGIINGYPDHTFRPNQSIRRDEMAQIVYKGVTLP